MKALGINREYSYTLMKVARAYRSLSPAGDTELLPASINQVRAFARLTDHPDLMQPAWEEAVRANNGNQPTAHGIEEIVKTRLPPQSLPPPDPVAPAEALQKVGGAQPAAPRADQSAPGNESGDQGDAPEQGRRGGEVGPKPDAVTEWLQETAVVAMGQRIIRFVPAKNLALLIDWLNKNAPKTQP